MVTIEAATIEGVNYVNQRMSSLDLLEIGAISFTEDPEIIGQQLFQMCENGYAWIFSRDGKPEAFYGCHEGIPGIWFVCGFRKNGRAKKADGESRLKGYSKEEFMLLCK